MKALLAGILGSVGLAIATFPVAGQPAKVLATLHAQPLNLGRIDPKLFGNFIELLDDSAQGMWAELLNDRSFEGVVPAANWSYYDGSPDLCDRAWETNATWILDTTNSFNGKQCAKLMAAAEPACLTQSGLGVKKGMTFTFSGHFRSEGSVQATVSLKCRLPAGDWMTLASARLSDLSAQWLKCTVKLPSAGTTDQAVFELRAEGQGNLWADELSLMPDDNLRGWRHDVVDAITEVRPGVIRWGGSSVDPGHYLWKRGIGDRDLRVPWRNAIWGRIDPNDIGIDEFCQFCELTGSEPLVCLSFADGAQSAADLVEYCNGPTTSKWGAQRAGNGHPAPYRVKYWQVGNEISGDNPQYLEQIGNFVAAIKQVEPQAQVLTSFPSQRLLDRVGKDIAFVCPHHYTTDLAACEREFQQFGAMIDQTPGGGDIKLGVTEWNIDAGAWGLGRAKMLTLDAALLNARYLHLMMRHADKVKIACRSNLANSYCGAIIETGMSGSGVLKRPSFHVMKLYSHHAQPVPLQIEQTGDRLDLVACGAEDHRTAVLFAVNSQPEPVDLTVEFKEFGAQARLVAAETVSDTMAAGQPDVANHWQVPERVKIFAVPVARNQVRLPGLSATALECQVN